MSNYGLFLEHFGACIAQRKSAEDQLQQLAAGPEPDQIALQNRIAAALENQALEVERQHIEYETVVHEVTEHFQLELANLRKSHESLESSIRSEAERAISDLVGQREESDWVINSVLDDSSDDSPVRDFEKFLAGINKSTTELVDLRSSLAERAAKHFEKQGWVPPPPAGPGLHYKNREKALAAFQQAVADGEQSLQTAQGLLLPKLFAGFRGLAVFITLAALVTIPLYQFVDPVIAGMNGPRLQANWIGVSSIGGAIGGLLVTVMLYSLGAMRQSELLHKLEQDLELARWSERCWNAFAEDEIQRREKRMATEQRRIQKERQSKLKRFESALLAGQAEIEAACDRKLKLEAEKYGAERNRGIVAHEQQLAKIQAEHQRLDQETERRWEGELSLLQAELQRQQSAQSRTYAEQWSRLKSHWEEETRQFFKAVSTIQRVDLQVNPPWELVASGEWQPAVAMPPGIRFGTLNIDLRNWPAGISTDVRLEPKLTTFQLPAEVAFPQQTSTLLKSSGHEARQQAIAALQTMMLRMLLLIPPGKLRFTLIDPISLGESFGGFMHLADYDELMVTNRIWTESGQIEARLADLTEHMENVFQTYLRNEFQTIEEYNASAGEVAEPYHILVISDFPTKFSEIAARRLVSIINSGPRCGVYTWLNLDPQKPLPNNFQLSDIAPHVTAFEWKENGFHATEAALAPWPIVIDSPPDPQHFTSIVKMVGEASKDARRVEVSFNRIAPDEHEIWSRDSRYELEIPLGRAGATKLQSMRLGKGTSQHMLVAGKTGSGKSTFLHILITNLALYYGPSEVNFFLIDFKKGVEFKDYATSHLPHAQVIAIESDREFGVSALQRLDEILQERGELFRRHGVQDIAGFRNSNPNTSLPRILLIVDEFQEFFIEDDKLSQTAAQLLDRLVRQGRAFGVHVILGSQTLGGAYSLARTTLGQVAVRVALQCSEADAHLILSEENTAARLLTRPGEAIYNDANGMAEGNHPFQIGWLSEQERRDYLKIMNARADKLKLPKNSPIVFEGNLPSDIRLNRAVQELVEAFSQRETPVTAPTIWLGDAVEIQPSTAITFHRQSGSQLLIVGQDAEAAAGILRIAAITLAASLAPTASAPSLYVFDGNPPDTIEAEQWVSLIDELPVAASRVVPREALTVLEQLDAELQRRSENPDGQHAPLFVLIDNIAKFRDLRKADDDFGIGSFGGSSIPVPPDPGKLFSNLLVEGPLHGMHCIIWCDSYSNVERCFSRHTLKELELRVALQMNPADSSNLIDTPAASRLGTHRALLYREETGQTEKFRPYGVPQAAWIRETGQTMRQGPQIEYATDLEEFSIL